MIIMMKELVIYNVYDPQVESPVTRSGGKWRQFDLFRHRRKKAVIQCFLATSFYSLPM